MHCQSSSRRRRPLRPNPARHRARGETWCVKPKRNPTCRSLAPSRRSPRKSRLESDEALTNLAPRYVSGQQYSITALTDSSAVIKECYAHDRHGNLSIFDASGTARSSTAEGNRYTYTGREWDDELGLYHFRARMHDPIFGRFSSRDPIGYHGSKWGLLNFVDNNPLKQLDPIGLWSDDEVGPDVTVGNIDSYPIDGWWVGVNMNFTMIANIRVLPCDCDGFGVVQWVTGGSATYLSHGLLGRGTNIHTVGAPIGLGCEEV